jgi:TPR repeat protein
MSGQVSEKEARRAITLYNLGVSLFYKEGGTKEDMARAGDFFRQAAERNHPAAQREWALCLMSGWAGVTSPKLAFDFMERAAETGDTQAKIDLAGWCRDGNGTAVDVARADRLLEECAKDSDPEALYELAQSRLDYDNPSRMRPDAISALEQAVKAGHGEAKISLGSCLLEGTNVAKDEPRAFALFREAADAGSRDARFFVARCLLHGHGVAQSDEAALAYYEESVRVASKLHLKGALADLGNCLREGLAFRVEDARVVRELETAVARGDPEAAIKLAECLETGKGTQKNTARAIKVLTAAALGGSLAARGHLGNRLLQTDGGEASGLTSLRQAVADGGMEAQFFLATRLLQGPCPGTGADTDPSPLQLLEDAAASGHVEAMVRLAEALQEGVIAPQDDQRAATLFAAASRAGSEAGMRRLGQCLTTGRGVAKDEARGERLRAATDPAAGAPGRNCLGLLFLDGVETAKDMPRAMRLFQEGTQGRCGNSKINYAACLLITPGRELHGKAVCMAMASWEFPKAVLDEVQDCLLFLASKLFDGSAYAVTKNETRAMEIYNEAAIRGSSAARQAIGLYRMMQ